MLPRPRRPRRSSSDSPGEHGVTRAILRHTEGWVSLTSTRGTASQPSATWRSRSTSYSRRPRPAGACSRRFAPGSSSPSCFRCSSRFASSSGSGRRRAVSLTTCCWVRGEEGSSRRSRRADHRAGSPTSKEEPLVVEELSPAGESATAASATSGCSPSRSEARAWSRCRSRRSPFASVGDRRLSGNQTAAADRCTVGVTALTAAPPAYSIR